MMRGYKGFNADMTCRGFQYEPGKVYEMYGEIAPCMRGFHFCQKMADVFDYYCEKGCRYAEVEAIGEILNKGNKSVTDRLHIVRELTREEIFDVMYAQEKPGFESIAFPADEIIQARETGALGEMLPSGTEFPVRFASGERNVLVACRDTRHTYLVTKYIMAEPLAMNDNWTNEGGWPACRMRKHVCEIYNMLPEDIQKAIIPMHIRQIVQNEVVECDDPAFLLSAVNVFGKKVKGPDAVLEDSQIDIFQKPAGRIKKRLGASSAAAWWLRSALGNYSFNNVYTDGNSSNYYACGERGVVVSFCIETRS